MLFTPYQYIPFDLLFTSSVHSDVGGGVHAQQFLLVPSHLSTWYIYQILKLTKHSNSSSKLFSTNFFPPVPNAIILNSTHHRHRSSLFYCWTTSRSPQSCQGAFCYFVRFDSQVRIYFLSDLWFHDLYLNQRRPSMSLTLQNNKVWNLSVQRSFIISKYADCKYEKW